MDRRRRVFSFALAVSLVPALWPLSAAAEDDRRSLREQAAIQRLTQLEGDAGGRLGVSVRDLGSWQRLDYRSEQRFPMCSTHKVLTVASILARVEQGLLRLDQQIPFGPAEMLDYAPICRLHVRAGAMSVAELCAAALQWSDNTAANLLLGLIGGPLAWTAYARSLGDISSRLDRVEPALNRIDPHGLLDTTTPAAMLSDLDALLFGSILGADSRQRLQRWLLAAQVTGPLLRAGLPPGWQVGDKSGAGQGGSRNDIGFLLPPGGSPLLVSVYYTGSSAQMSELNHVIAEVGMVIATMFG